jgi:predicted dehydrogenase
VNQTGKTLAVGVVGAGYVGQLAHIANLCDYERCRVVALTDLRPELTRQVAARYGIPRVYPSHRELLDDGEVEAVVVVTMRHATGPIVLDVLRSGRHVLSEKPMAHTVEQGERLVRAARERDLRYAVGFMKRHDPGVVRARDVLREYRDGTSPLGALQFVRAYSMHGDVGLDTTRTVMTQERRPGGIELWPVAPAWLDAASSEDYAAFLNVHGHAVNLLRFLFGEPLTVEPAAPRASIVRSLKFDLAGVPGVLEMRDVANGPWTEGIDAYFERGSVHLTLPPPFATGACAGTIVRDLSGNRIVEPRVRDWAFRRQARAWVDDCLEGRSPLANGVDSLADLIVAESIWPSKPHA